MNTVFACSVYHSEKETCFSFKLSGNIMRELDKGDLRAKPLIQNENNENLMDNLEKRKSRKRKMESEPVRSVKKMRLATEVRKKKKILPQKPT